MEDKGLKNVRDKILVSDRCHIVLDLHVAVDGLEEVELGGSRLFLLDLLIADDLQRDRLEQPGAALAQPTHASMRLVSCLETFGQH